MAKQGGHGSIWDKVTAFASLTIAIATLAVVFYQAHLMRQQTRAATWPYLSVQSSVGGGVLKFIVTNSGVGPARLESVTVAVDGKPMRTWSEVIEALTGATPPPDSFGYSDLDGYVFAPQETRDALTVADPALLAALGPQMRRLSGSICYCSVLDECTLSKTIAAAGLERDRDTAVRDRCAAQKALVQFDN